MSPQNEHIFFVAHSIFFFGEEKKKKKQQTLSQYYTKFFSTWTVSNAWNPEFFIRLRRKTGHAQGVWTVSQQK